MIARHPPAADPPCSLSTVDRVSRRCIGQSTLAAFRIALFSCEFDGRVAVVDGQTHQLIRMIDMPTRNTTMGPQDLRIAPDGSKVYIADSGSRPTYR